MSARRVARTPLDQRSSSISRLGQQKRLAWTPTRDTQRGFSVATGWTTPLPSRKIA